MKATTTSAETRHRDLQQALKAAEASRVSAEASAHSVAEMRTQNDRAIQTAGQTAAAQVATERDRLETLLKRVEKAVASWHRTVGWSLVGRIAAGLMPTLMVALIVGSLLSGVFQALGFAPIAAWVISCFIAVHAWWAKIGIILAGVAGFVGFVLLCGWLAMKLRRMYLHW